MGIEDECGLYRKTNTDILIVFEGMLYSIPYVDLSKMIEDFRNEYSEYLMSKKPEIPQFTIRECIKGKNTRELGEADFLNGSYRIIGQLLKTDLLKKYEVS